jgi:Uma2 family endonuclease
LGNWSLADGTGTVFDSSTGFKLSNGATRAPDAAWVHNERLSKLSPEQYEKFLPLCPEFAIELLSPSDRLISIQAKMEEYIANGTELGWLIDPPAKTVYVYTPDNDPDILKNVDSISADPMLPDFVMDLSKIW